MMNGPDHTRAHQYSEETGELVLVLHICSDEQLTLQLYSRFNNSMQLRMYPGTVYSDTSPEDNLLLGE